MAPRSLRITAGASRRAICGVSSNGSATGLAFRKPGFPSRSASSWQGLLVVPGGAPLPPECPACVAKPAGAAPRPASSFASRSALQLDEVMETLREVLAAGIRSLAGRRFAPLHEIHTRITKFDLPRPPWNPWSIAELPE